MTKEQFLLLKLAEECQEVAKRAIKQIQFGADQVWKGGEVKDGVAPKEAGLTNAQRLLNELADLAVIAQLLGEAEQLPVPPIDDEFEELISKKVEKLNKYLAYARSLGQIDGDWTIQWSKTH